LKSEQDIKDGGWIRPVDEHAAAGCQARLDKGVGGREVLQQVLVVHVVDGDVQMVLEGAEAGAVGAAAHDGDDMGDVGVGQRKLIAQGQEARTRATKEGNGLSGR
ncbi:hypothetical protein LOY88_006907, partial [Ophidiomyces ophidiicola]